jgi:catechol 2,3-dioxygenase-like lactoylglutathione lyase family enzyme
MGRLIATTALFPRPVYNDAEFQKEHAMPDLPAPVVECDQIHAGVAAPDLGAAIAFYTTKLGFKLGFTWGDPPTFAGVNLGEVQMFLQKGTPEPKGCEVYFLVGDADELYEFHRTQGVEIVEPIDDRPYEIRDYRVRDLNGYHLCFGHHLFNAGPRIKIERVDVPVRLEKRLAALLQDLALHKRMTVNSCLEEMLLHTNEGVGPHTKTTLRYIEELKKKHGIDYDSHGSYRFTEE